MTLSWKTAYKWASSSKQIAAWCLNRNSTVAGVIITVTFCIISVCALWIWGRMMAALMNQWANEAAIVLVYWNTLRTIEDFCSDEAECSAVILPDSHAQQRGKNVKNCSYIHPANRTKPEKKSGKEKSKSFSKGQNIVFFQLHSTDYDNQGAVWSEDVLRGQISWLGNLVRATCRAADYPWASIIFCLSKNVNCLFLRVGKRLKVNRRD